MAPELFQFTEKLEVLNSVGVASGVPFDVAKVMASYGSVVMPHNLFLIIAEHLLKLMVPKSARGRTRMKKKVLP